jgi:hypothetical protein
MRVRVVVSVKATRGQGSGKERVSGGLGFELRVGERVIGLESGGF